MKIKQRLRIWLVQWMIITLIIIIHITKNKMWHNGITIPINTFGCELRIKI